MLTPLEIHNRKFRRAFRGYDCREVDAYMGKVIESYEILVQKDKWTLREGVPVTREGKRLLTPLEIHNQEFNRVFRGYDADEVNDFLDLVIQSMEQLIKENEPVHKTEQEVNRLSPMEILNKEFKRDIRGYDCGEVDDYIRKIAENYEILVQKDKWTLREGIPVTRGGKRLLSPLDVHNQEFTRVMRGYDVDEVNDFLDRVIRSMELLIKEKRQSSS